ncbi:MAG: menaquinone biosynthesis protein [Bacteroidota bacterium]|nr:menaquinone biosynthesis protein [Bacteroidota bacterium]
MNAFGENIIGKIPFLNSVSFYHNLEKKGFKILPVSPRRMGMLSKQGQLDAGLFSLMDYFEQEEQLELLDLCIATRDQVKSVMLFSKEGWAGLNGKKIGITDETATSVQLLSVLLENKYRVQAVPERLHPGVNDYSMFDAVLLIGDEALKHNKRGLNGFELAFDLAKEWYDWQKLPFVFAVWACRKALSGERREELKEMISDSLEKSEIDLGGIGYPYGKSFGLTKEETKEYLEGFNYRLGERELEAMNVFKSLIVKINVIV